MAWPAQVAFVHLGYYVLGVVLPGAALLSLTPRRIERRDASPAELLLACSAAGALLGLVELLVFLALGEFLPVRPFAGLLLGLSLAAFLLIASRRYRSERLDAILRPLGRWLVSPEGLALLTGALVCGAVAVRGAPHVLDCGQLRWTQDLVDGLRPQQNSGALAYSAWILFPGALFPGLPLASSAAGAKVPLFVLLFAAGACVAGRLLPRHRGAAAIALLAIVLASYLGLSGFFDLGKDSMFGLVFTLALFGTLAGDDLDETQAERALFFGAAISLGVITAPYLLLLGAVLLVTMRKRLSIANELLALAIFGGGPLVIALVAMLRAPVLVAAALWIALVLFLFLIRSRPPSAPSGKRTGLAATRWLPGILQILLVVACTLLMPVRVEVHPWVDVKGVPIVEARAPLDGQTTFPEFLLGSPAGRLAKGAGLAVLFLYAFRRPERRSPGLLALALLIPAACAVILTLVRLPSSPLTGFNLWDLLRDVPGWLGPLLFGVFAVELMSVAIAVFDGEGRRAIAAWSLSLGIAGWLVAVRLGALGRLLTPAHVCDTTGHRDASFAELADALWKNRRGFSRVLVPAGSAADRYFYSLQMFTDARVVGFRTDDPDDMEAVFRALPNLVPADDASAARIVEAARDRPVIVRRLAHPARPALLSISDAARVVPETNLPTPHTFPRGNEPASGTGP